MISKRKLQANRRNALKSTGPRTRRGKARSSRNALRHGIATITSCNPTYAEEIERMATMICAGNPDPLLFEQAARIAECDVLLRCISDEKLAAIERVCDATTLALSRQQQRSPVQYEALEAAAPDLERLFRYERRTRSRQKRATRALIAIKTDCAATHSATHANQGPQQKA